MVKSKKKAVTVIIMNGDDEVGRVENAQNLNFLSNLHRQTVGDLIEWVIEDCKDGKTVPQIYEIGENQEVIDKSAKRRGRPRKVAVDE